MQQLSLYFRQLISVSQAAKVLQLSEQRVRQLGDTGVLPCVRIPDPVTGDRFFHREDVEREGLERQVRQLMTGAKKRGPKGPRRSVAATRPKQADAFARELEAATA